MSVKPVFRTPAPKPKSALGYHRVLSLNAGIKVSPLCLGAMNFGTAWQESMGECKKEDAFAIMDTFYENGGNFIDISNNYQFGESEQWVGEWMQTRQNRDQMVIATKYTAPFLVGKFDKISMQSNFNGNSMKSMHVSVKHSLEKLQTDYIDILYVHCWDLTTSVEEVMHGLDTFITAGKVLYLGISDTPAWIVVKANDYARAHGLRPFSIYQGKWNAMLRDMERDIIPMCRDQGMAIAPFGALGQGKFKTAAARKAEHTGAGRAKEMSEDEVRISDALEAVANRKNATLHAVALAYVLKKTPYVFPIVGQRKVDHLHANISALTIELTPEDLVEIESAVPFNPGFPWNLMFEFPNNGQYDLTITAADCLGAKIGGYIDAPPYQQAIKPRKDV